MLGGIVSGLVENVTATVSNVIGDVNLLNGANLLGNQASQSNDVSADTNLKNAGEGVGHSAQRF